MTTFFLILLAFTGVDPLTINLVDEIPLPSEIDISQVEFVDVNEDGNLLLTDLTRESVVLYDAETQTFRELNPEDCHPGFAFHPIRSQFINGMIWVFNRQSQVFKFQDNGDCRGNLDQQIAVPDFFSDVNEKTLVGLKPLDYNLSRPTLYFYDGFGEEKKMMEIGDQILAPTLSFRYGGGGMFAVDNLVYFAMSSAPVIYSYNVIDETIGRFLPDENMKLSIVQNEDIQKSRGSSLNFLNEVRDFLSKFTTTLNFDRLNDQYALLHVQQPGDSSREILVFDLDENEFLKESYKMNEDTEEFYYAFGNSKAYNLSFRDQQDRWVLEVYKVEIQP